MKDLKKMVIALAELYGEVISENRMTLYVSLLGEFRPEEVQQAIRKVCSDPKISRFPLPAQIIAQIRPAIDIDGESRDGAARIIGAIKKFGWHDQEGAKKYLGEICWKAIDTMGGWVSICENMRIDEITTYQAQFRELIKSTIQRRMAGIENLTPGEVFFPKASRDESVESLPIRANFKIGRPNE